MFFSFVHCNDLAAENLVDNKKVTQTNYLRPIITLTTDWGLKDYFSGALKGAILRAVPSAALVDITHLIAANTIGHAAYTFKNAWKHFPDNTIHFIGIETETKGYGNLIAFEFEKQFFIGYDCGIFSMIFENMPTAIYKIDGEIKSRKNNYSPVVDFIKSVANGISIEKTGKPINTWLEKTFLIPNIEKNHIVGHVIYIDEYGNLITNIERNIFEYTRNDRDFVIQIKSQGYQIKTISNWYHDVDHGELVAIFNEAGTIEIGINGGKASQLFNMKYNNTIRIEFNDNKNRKTDANPFSLS